MPSLVIKDISYEYDGHAVIDNLSLQVEKNEIICLLGASGCGKTTTLKAIAGLLRPSQGEITIHQTRVSGDKVFLEPQHRNIGMMFQDYALFPHLTVQDNIAYGLKTKDKNAKHQRVLEMLELVHLSEFANRFPHELSGGQQQRVAIARALAYKPDLLLLDEPFSNIDSQVRFQLIEDIRRIIKDQQVAAIFVSHSKDEAFAFADKLAIMHQGKIAQLGCAQTLFEQPRDTVVAEFLGKGIYLPATRFNGASVTTPLGDLHSLTPIAQEGKGKVYIRPQHLELSNESSSIVEVLQQRFVGTEYMYRIKVAEQEIEVPMPASNSLDLSQPVSLKIKAHAVNFFS